MQEQHYHNHPLTVDGTSVIAGADVAAGLPGTVGFCGQRRLFHVHRPNSHNSDILCQHHPTHSILLKSHLEIYSQTHKNPSLSKGSIQNILLTLLPQEPSLLCPWTLIKRYLCAWFMCMYEEGVLMHPCTKSCFCSHEHDWFNFPT